MRNIKAISDKDTFAVTWSLTGQLVPTWRKVTTGSPDKGLAFEMLEPYAGKLACTFLRGLDAGNGLWLLEALDSLLDKTYDMTYHLDIQKSIY